MIPELKASKALEILRPNGGWAIVADDFNSIVYDEGVEPITKKQFDDTLKIAEKTYLAEIESKTAARQAIADRLGLTANELQVLLG